MRYVSTRPLFRAGNFAQRGRLWYREPMRRYGMASIVAAVVGLAGLSCAVQTGTTRLGMPDSRIQSVANPKGEPSAPLAPFWAEGRGSGAGSVPITSELYASLADKVNPAVVTIFTREKVGGVGDPLGLFFLELPIPGTGLPGLGREAKSLGSGFIISKDGYVLTNAHVVQKASDMEVYLHDSNEEVSAKVIGYQKILDFALLRIPPSSTLTAAPLGDSDDVRIGDFILAIGNPFGMRHTLTTGNVSALERHLPLSRKRHTPHGFIQTDAAINPGNSGGPLLNLRGEVIGINSAIATPSGGSVGIGFALPVNYVRELLPRVRKHGDAELAYLGIQIGRVTDTIADKHNLPGRPRGALIVDVYENTPALRAGLRKNDIILALNNRSIPTDRSVLWMAMTSEPGKPIPLTVWRDGKQITLTVTPDRI